ncbi:RHS repeat-associated core domain-containing protein [Klebsiella pasteurii]
MVLQLTGTNRNGSPELSLSAGTSTAFAWSTFGDGTARTGNVALLPGFNGERQDPLSGVTHLGNGYRAYSPALRRFTCPDSESPFGVGGINPYVYCDHDPVNKTDPSGHGGWSRIRNNMKMLTQKMSEESAESMSTTVANSSSINSGIESSLQGASGIPQSERNERSLSSTSNNKQGVNVEIEVLPKGTVLYKASPHEIERLDFSDNSNSPWSGTYFAEKKDISKGYLYDYDTPYLHKFILTEDILTLRFDHPFLINVSIAQEKKAEELTLILARENILKNPHENDYKKFTTLLENMGYGYKGLHSDDDHEIILRNALKQKLMLIKSTKYIVDYKTGLLKKSPLRD